MKLVRWGASLMLAGFVGVALTGCGYSLQKTADMDKLRAENTSLQEMNTQQAGNIAALSAERDKLNNALTLKDTTIKTATGMATTMNDALEVLKQQLAEANKRATEMKATNPITGVAMEGTKEGVVLKIGGDVLFSSGKNTLKKEGEQTLDKVADLIEKEIKKQPSLEVRVAGFTDSAKISKSGWEDNFQLSGERAREVLKHLEKKGVPATHLSFAGYGANHLVMANGKEDMAASRRVEILLAPGGPQLASAAAPKTAGPEKKEAPASKKETPATKAHTPPSPTKKGPPTKS